MLSPIAIGETNELKNSDAAALLNSSTKSCVVDELLMDAQMQSRAEVLFDVEKFVNVNELPGSVSKLITSGKFSSLVDSNVVQFKKEFRDINFGFWGTLFLRGGSKKRQQKLRF